MFPRSWGPIEHLIKEMEFLLPHKEFLLKHIEKGKAQVDRRNKVSIQKHRGRAIYIFSTWGKAVRCKNPKRFTSPIASLDYKGDPIDDTVVGTTTLQWCAEQGYAACVEEDAIGPYSFVMTPEGYAYVESKGYEEEYGEDYREYLEAKRMKLSSNKG